MNSLRMAMFVHSLRSDWNNGNAHFLRGLARSLVEMGHSVRCYEPEQGWSIENLIACEGATGKRELDRFSSTYPDIEIRTYKKDVGLDLFILNELRDIDIILVHEWNDPELVDTILEVRDHYGSRALFHDTHHRASSSPESIQQLQINRFDGILAFGESLQEIYRSRWGLNNTWTFHEAADTSVFRPISTAKKTDVVWVGNWGDEERTRELEEFLINPAKQLEGHRFVVHGVRYPREGREALAQTGIEYKGYLPNLSAPCAYAESLLTLHVPRREYANILAGIPTIRVFEALACGIPLVSAPWADVEELFRPDDFRMVRSGSEMIAVLRELLLDAKAREQQAVRGLETILQRHSCRHRAEQLTEICEDLLS